MGRALFGIRIDTVGRAGGQRPAVAARRRPSAGYGSPVRRMAVAAVGRPEPHLRRPPVAHRVPRGRACAAQRAPDRGHRVPGGGAALRGGLRPGLPVGLPVRPGRREDPHRDRRTGSADRRTDAQLRHRNGEGRLRQGAVAGHRRVPIAVDRPAAGVQKVGATANEYWAVSSAILSASPDQAGMLLALQGQRGDDRTA